MKKLEPGINDFETFCKKNNREELLEEWDYEKNGELTPDRVLAKSEKKIWWICPKGHSYQAMPSNRVLNNTGCPYCSGKKVLQGFNDLGSVKPELLKEWDYNKNSINGVYPEDVSVGSGKLVWWKCSRCGFEYYKAIATVARGHACKICGRQDGVKKLSDSLLKKAIKSNTVADYPNVAKEWDYEKNGELTPDRVLAKSEKKIWWICPKGHSYQAIPGNRTANNTGCPYCNGKKVLPGFNDFASISCNVMQYWNYDKNTNVLPTEVTAFSSRRDIWWKCPKCGYEWKATPNAMSNGTQCPNCSTSEKSSLPEQALFYYFNKLTETKTRTRINGWEVDVYLPRLNIAIEYDGVYFHEKPDVIKRDGRKDLDLSNHGITLIRVKESLFFREDEGNIIYYDRSKRYKYYTDTIKRVITRVSTLSGCEFHTDVDFERDRTDILQSYKKYKKSNSIVATNPEIISEWNYTKNGSMTPEMFTKGSGEKVWWKCTKGHEWKATVASRAAGHACPYCSGFKWKTGEGDLQTRYPEIAKEWDYEKNGFLSPNTINPGSHKKVWWICDRGHSFQSSPLNRTNKTNHCGCPYCSNKKVLKGFNDLNTVFPEYAIEWNFERNRDLTPDQVVYGSHKVVWWKCQKCGFEWQTKVLYRTRNHSNCPKCKNKVF